MSKHTPGPWKVWENQYGDTFVHGRNPKTEVVALVYGELESELRTANARLIAAAPDLLAACEAFVAAQVTLKDEPTCILGADCDAEKAAYAAMLAAITKATGAQP